MTQDFYQVLNRQQFQELLHNNPGKVVIKFGAEWCGPCKKIEPYVKHVFETYKHNKTVQCIMVDIDDSFDLYAYMKTKKQVNGIPAILCWHKGNETIAPNDSVIGANQDLVTEFFMRVYNK